MSALFEVLNPRNLSAPIAHLILLADLVIAAGVIVVAARNLPRPRLYILAAGLTAPLAAFAFLISDSLWAFEDFRAAYLPAGQAVLQSPEALAPILAEGVDGFVNLPIVAYLFAPFGLFSERIATLAFFGGGLAALALAWGLLVRAYALKPREAALLMLGIGAFGPAIYSLREGNTTHLLLIPLIVGMLLVRARRDVLAGAAFGLAAVIKPPLLLIGGLYFLRGRWKVALGGGLVCLAAGAASVALFGWDAHVAWYQQCIQPYSRHPLAAFNVQSIASLMSKLQYGPAHLRDWNPLPLAPALWTVVTIASVALAGLGVAAALLSPRDGGLRAPSQSALEAELMLALVLAAALSPLAWSHYYAWLILPAAYLLALAGGPGRPRLKAALAAGWLLSTPAVFWGGYVGSGAVSALAASHLLFGALILYGAVAWVRFESRPGAA